MNASEAMTEAKNFNSMDISPRVYVYAGSNRMDGRIINSSGKTVTVSYRRWDKVHVTKFNRNTGSEWGTNGEWGMSISRADIIDTYLAERAASSNG